MDSKKSNKIRDIVRLQQILKKWKNKAVNGSKNDCTDTPPPSSSSNGGASKSIKFLKRTLSFQDVSNSGNGNGDAAVPKGFLAVCVGRETTKRFTIPTEYLRHRCFVVLLREAEEEFGFHHEGVLKIPCDVAVFEKILKVVQGKREVDYFVSPEFDFGNDAVGGCCCSPPSDCDLTPHHPQMCR